MEGTREAIDRVVELAAPTLQLVDGRTYSSKGLHPVVEPTPDKVGVSGLAALADFLRWENPAGLADLIAKVENEQLVTVYGRLRAPWAIRPVLAAAVFSEGTRFPFGQFMDQRSFLIGMQVGFVQDTTTAKLLTLVGTIKDSKVLDLKDDGVTQQVSASVGLAKLGLVDVPNPVTLRPYRTFPEVEQPASQYVIRMQSGKGEEVPSIALFEVQDPSWRRASRLAIKDYLRAQLTDLTVLA